MIVVLWKSRNNDDVIRVPGPRLRLFQGCHKLERDESFATRAEAVAAAEAVIARRARTGWQQRYRFDDDAFLIHLERLRDLITGWAERPGVTSSWGNLATPWSADHKDGVWPRHPDLEALWQTVDGAEIRVDTASEGTLCRELCAPRAQPALRKRFGLAGPHQVVLTTAVDPSSQLHDVFDTITGRITEHDAEGEAVGLDQDRGLATWVGGWVDDLDSMVRLMTPPSR